MLSCINYEDFDAYYVEGDYYQAFQELQKFADKDDPEYYIRRFRVVIRIALDGDTDFFTKLEALVDDYYDSPTEYPSISNYVILAESFITFNNNDDYNDYVEIISNLSPINPVPPEFLSFAYKIRGIANYKIGNYESAVDDLKASYLIEPYIDNYYYIAMSYYGLGQYEESIRFLEDVTANSTDDFMKSLAYFQLGEIYYHEDITNSDQNYLKALKNYVNAVNSYSDSATYNYKIAKCLQKLGYETIFPRFLKTSLRIEPDYANAWYLLNIN